ncbi:hypothetical protein JZU46_00135 [bacterium]|nr:hypothetical protein [bacterium]
MINLTLTVPNIKDVIILFSKLELLKYSGTTTPAIPINSLEFLAVPNGIDQINNRTSVSDIVLSTTFNQYYFVDPDGNNDSWYISRYTNANGSSTSGWSEPMQGEIGDFYYNPLFPAEVDYSTDDKRIINRLRLLIGDPIGLERLSGHEAESNLHTDKQVFELEEKGWPCSINMYGTQFTSTLDPTVNGYTFLRFKNTLDTTIKIVSGIEQTIDIWYYTFRHSDSQIMEAFDNCYPPTPLTSVNCTQDIYILQTAYDLLNSETWEAISENGAIITDDKDSYNPSPGLSMRDKMLTKLKDRLESAIKAVRLSGIGGVRID